MKELGQDSLMKVWISFASFNPRSAISFSVFSSFAAEHSIKASGCSIDKLFLMSFMSKEFPWNPWARIIK